MITVNKFARSLAVFVFIISISVFPFNTASAQTGCYFGVFGGYTLSPDASWHDNVFDADLDVQSTGAFGVKFGYTPPLIKFFSFEFEYSYLNHDVDRTILATAGSDYAAIEGDIKFNNFMFNAIAKYPEGKIHPYLGAGLGASYVDVSVTSSSRLNGVNYSERSSTDDTLFAWQILVGVDIDLTNNLSLDIGYRYFGAESQDDHHDDYYYDDPTLDYKTSMVTLGLKYRF
ncbi:MAG: outer membrane protein [Legionellales bacterium]